MTSERIKNLPGPELTYQPTDSHYSNADSLRVEIERVFDICVGCRLCFNICPSFPALLDYADQHDGEVRGLSQANIDEVVDKCYQCKLCDLKCPYTPGDEHEFQLSFAGLMQRAKVEQRNRRGTKLRDWVLSKPDLLGKVAGLTPAIVNYFNRLSCFRLILEKVLGVHRKKILPAFEGQTFQSWFAKHRPQPKDAQPKQGEVFLFQTCFVNFNAPHIGKAAIDVLERNNCGVTCDYKNCCGMPALDSGDVKAAQRLAQNNVELLFPHVKSGKPVVVINPTCALTMKHEYPGLLDDPRAKEVSEAVVDVHEYLYKMRKEGSFNQDFKSAPSELGYHVPCHLRAQQIGYRTRDIMRLMDGCKIHLVAECCGHDGTWAMKKEFFELSLEVGQKAFNGLEKHELTVTDCPMAAIQFEQKFGKRPLHPLEVLSKAYQGEEF